MGELSQKTASKKEINILFLSIGQAACKTLLEKKVIYPECQEYSSRSLGPMWTNICRKTRQNS